MKINFFKKLRYGAGSFKLKAKIFLKITTPPKYIKVFTSLFKASLGIQAPSSAAVGLTYRCQLKCVHCSAGRYKVEEASELSARELKKLFIVISGMGVPRINLTGGESLLRKDIFDVVKDASARFVTILESNGLLMTPETAKDLKKAGLSCAAISLDTSHDALHDYLRGRDGCFKKAVEGIKNCASQNLPCIISTYVTEEKTTSQNLKGLFDLAEGLHALAVRIMPLRPVGSFSCKAGSLLSSESEKKVMGYLRPDIAYFKGLPAPRHCGIFNRATFYISPYGEVQPCPYLPMAFGNIRNESLGKILDRMWHHAVFKKTDKQCLILDKKFCKENLDLEQAKNILPINIS